MSAYSTIHDRLLCISWIKLHLMERQEAAYNCLLSAEAEYRSMAAATAELTWISYLLRDLRVPLPKLPTLFTDNISALYLTYNPILHARTKHYHFVREKANSGALVTKYVPSSDQLADIFTKSLSKGPFMLIRMKLGVQFHSAPRFRGSDEPDNTIQSR
ncbi:hypothetical protein LUZ60_010332 [Juncus effusus]|nr:hypothetical protein LUZ60_010332 [Juncus effusus]